MSEVERLNRALFAPTDGLGAWLDSVTAAFAACFRSEIGAVGRLYDQRAGKTLGGYAVASTHSPIRSLLRRMQTSSRDRLDFLQSGRGPLRSVRQVGLQLYSHDSYLGGLRERSAQFGIHDMHHLTVDDGDDLWVTLGILTGDEAWVEPNARRVATLVNNLRLGLSLQRNAERLALDLGGSNTRTHLREALRLLDRDNTTAQCGASQRWIQMIREEWSIVDRHVWEGRHYWVVVPPRDAISNPLHLSRREAQVAALAAEGHGNKWIGFALGNGPSTVATQLKRALAKLGMSSRVELAACFYCWPESVHVDPAPHFVPVPRHNFRVTPLSDDRLLLAFDTSLTVSRSLCDTIGERQYHVLSLALQSKSDREIARELDLTTHVVANDLRMAYLNFGVSSRAELFAMLAKRGVVFPS